MTEKLSMEPMDLTYEQMSYLHEKGVVGTIEFRNWLANFDKAFEKVRDEDVDNMIMERAHQIAASYRRVQEERNPEIFGDHDQRRN